MRRPMIKRAGRRGLRIRNQVPLSDGRGRIAILAQDLGQHGGALGNRSIVAGIRQAPIGDDPHAHGVVIAAGQQRRARGRAHGRHVELRIAKPLRRQPIQCRRGDQAAKGAGLSVPRVVQQDEQDIGRTRRRREGRPRHGRRLRHRSANPALKRRRRNGQDASIRSCRPGGGRQSEKRQQGGAQGFSVHAGTMRGRRRVQATPARQRIPPAIAMAVGHSRKHAKPRRMTRGGTR